MSVVVCALLKGTNGFFWAGIKENVSSSKVLRFGPKFISLRNEYSHLTCQLPVCNFYLFFDSAGGTLAVGKSGGWLPWIETFGNFFGNIRRVCSCCIDKYPESCFFRGVTPQEPHLDSLAHGWLENVKPVPVSDMGGSKCVCSWLSIKWLTY